MPTRTYPLDAPFDLVRTVRPLARGTGDPTLRIDGGRVWWVRRTPDGLATLLLRTERDDDSATGRELHAEAWGPGAESALEGLAVSLGLSTPPWSVADAHPLVTQLARQFQGVRLTRTGAVLDALVPAILEQKVTGGEARRAWRLAVLRYGEPAPGPGPNGAPGPSGAPAGLRAAPTPAALAALPYYAWHPFGVEQRRADLIRRVAARAAWFEAIVDVPLPDAYARLLGVPGIGPWTAAEVAVRALGDPDAVSVGDFHLPNLVAWALAHEPRADDRRMLELLEPWRGQRAHVIRLLELSGISAPRYGPRLTPRRIERE